MESDPWTRFWQHSDNRIPLRPRTPRKLHRPTFAPAWIDYATTKQVEMESAAKRKAASAAMGDSDGRPAKRQKVPVRAAPQGVECIVGGGPAMRESGVGRDAGWAARWNATAGFVE